MTPCGENKRVNDRDCKERCGRRAVGYVASGPMPVCRQHAAYWERQGETIIGYGPW